MVGKLYERLHALAEAALRHAPADQLLALRKMLEQALRQRQHKRQQPWANLSQALRQVGAERRLPTELRQALHALRLTANRVLHENYAATPADVLAGFEALAALLGSLSGVHYNGPRPPVPPAEVAAYDHGTPQPAPWAGPTWFVHVLSVDEPTGRLLVEAETPGAGNTPAEPFWLQLPEAYATLADAAQALRPALLLHGPHQPLPAGADGRPAFQPARVVLEPDYLISVTTVAECVDWKRDLPDWAIQRAFQPDQPSRALLFGNLVNQVLDEEISREDFEFADFVSSRLFRTNALSLSALVEVQTTEGLRTLLADLRQHHRTLRQTKRAGFVATSHSGYQQQPLRPEDCFLEPSFLSATYGLQGRLDLLHESADGYDLIELKSTRSVPDKLPWMNHQAQAQLYRLLLGSTTGEGEPARGRTSILYSAASTGDAAVKPVLRDEPLIDRLLTIRNQLVARELLLAQAAGPAQVAELLRPVLQPEVETLPRFSQDKAREVADAWARADATERAYCLELVRFAARELRLTMLGADARPGDVGGQAGLWRSSDERKIQSFALLDNLELLEDHTSGAGYPDGEGGSLGPCLVFRRAPDGPPVNFRAGDTLLLYPRRHRQRPERLLGPLECQVAKVTLALDLGADGRVVVGLRATRLGARYLASHSHWALEPDTYDSYRREWAGLSAFLGLPAQRRQRLLARTAPRPPQGWQPGTPPATAAPEVVRRALAAPDWFVLCGPPGTGKTRSVLRELAQQLYHDDKHALLAAYTNRAVDEICEQLVDAKLPFIRVGSRLGTAPAYREYLLEYMIRDCPTRASVKARLAGTPFYVGTVAGLLGKPELFELKKFDLAVVDEASQVLESPMLALLARVPKFILIGDHRQLPAVVAQEPAESAVAPEAAELLQTELGLRNLRNSYFERLFRRAEIHWPYAHGTLANHYRMHADLVALVNDDFYQGQLHCPEFWQHQPLSRPAWPHPADAFLQRVRDERLLFVPTRRQPTDRSLKESSQEAELAARAAAFVAQGYGPDFNPEKSLGIIASYRNQAARIRTRLAQLADELALPALTQVSVDTVERYQGSQREVIIVSFCCHQEHQLETMVSPDETGTVDRKLNVALTRARQQLILLGNEEILRHVPHHAALLKRCGVL